jgi:phosphoenolpyruvate synthase/pyruvate phosphate dikinase
MAGEKDILIEGKLLSLRLRELENRIKAREATDKDVLEYRLKLKRKNEIEARVNQELKDRIFKLEKKKLVEPTKKEVNKLGKERIKLLREHLKHIRPR